MPWPSTSRLRLVPFLARSVGFLPVFFPPEGCLGHAPVHAQPLPVDTLQAGVFQQPRLPQRREDPRSDPLLKAVMRRGPRAELGGVQRFPLATGAQHEQDGIHADPVGRAWPSTAEAMGIDVAGQVHLNFTPQGVRDTPVVGNRVWVHDRTENGEPAARN
jgi:hypothetical protein